MNSWLKIGIAFILLLLVLYFFFPLQLYQIKKAVTGAFARIDYEEAIVVKDNCDLRSVEYLGSAFGLTAKDIVNEECKKECTNNNLKYASYGCKDDKLVCYCK